MSVHTGKGDSGYTETPAHGRVSKASLPIRVLGELDELNCSLGLVRCRPELRENDRVVVRTVQEHVRGISCEISCGVTGSRSAGEALDHNDGSFLRGAIQEREREKPPERGFRLPGGNEVSARIDISRAAARRAERSIAAMNEQNTKVSPDILLYLNRLSDLLYVMARQYDPVDGQSARYSG